MFKNSRKKTMLMMLLESKWEILVKEIFQKEKNTLRFKVELKWRIKVLADY